MHPIRWQILPNVPSTFSDKLPLAAFFASGTLQTESLSAMPEAAIAGSFLHRFKPYLNLTIPFQSPQTQAWVPQIRQSETQTFPLILVQETLTALLSVLKPQVTTVVSQVEGLSSADYQQAMTELAAVVVNQPVGSSDAYRFNLREAVLAAGLVNHPEQVYFLEEAIAALLPELHQSSAVAAEPRGTLVISAGTSTTELVLAKCPADGHALSRSEIALSRLAYAGNALDQDIICQLLAPSASQWDALSLNTLNLPLPGEPDLEARYRLQQRLESVPLGQALLQAVRQIKPTLCQQDVNFSFQGQNWPLHYRDLQRWILVPYLQQLNREVNLLLTQLELTPDAIHTIVCTGGTTAIAAIEHGLQRKFPQATIVHSSTRAKKSTPEDVTVSVGLALLPYFPAILDTVRHQFSEYFLLRTTLKTLPVQAEPISATHIQHLLETQRIPLVVSQKFVAVLLEGQFPPGLVLSKASALLLSPESLQTVDYQELTAAPLFSHQGNQVYRLNRQQRDRLWNHLQIILANTRQTLAEPLAIDLLVAEKN